MQIAVNHNNCGCIIVQITDNYRHGLLFCQLTGSVPPVSGYQLITGCLIEHLRAQRVRLEKRRTV